MSLDSIVNISISVQGRAPEQRDVGTPLLLGYHEAWLGDLVREYEQAAEMLEDGFTADDDLYKAALIVKSQDPAPQRFKIGRRVAPLTQIIEITPTITTEGFVYKGTIDGLALSYTVGAGANLAAVCTALAAAINALAVDTTADGTSGTKVVCTADNDGEVVAFDLSKGMDLKDATVDTTTDNELADIAAEDDDWYGLVVIDSGSKATALHVAAWTEAQKKESLFQTPDSDVGDANEDEDTMSAIKDSSYARTGVVYHRKIGGVEWLAAGALAGQLAHPPGSATPAFKEVTGVSTDRLSTGFANAILAKNGSWYQSVAGVGTFYEGKTGSGEFLDTTRFVDWQYFDMQDAVFLAFLNAPKIPFTDTGVDILRNVISASLARGVTAGGLAADPAPTVTAPKVANVSAQNRINRRLPDVKFEATLAGAIHGLVVRGVIAV